MSYIGQNSPMKGNKYRIDMSVAHLYKITNKQTGEYYVGKHCGYDQKKSGGGFYWGSGNRIRNSIKKYGKENFTYEILVYGSVDYIIELEAKYVTKELIQEDRLCLNLMTGGEARRTYSRESIEKIILAQKGKKRNLSEAQRKKMSDAKKGKTFFLGKKHTEETKKRIREIRAKQVFSKESAEKRKQTISSLVWMNDGIRSYRIRPENIQAAKEKGYVEGRLTTYVDDNYKEKIRMNAKEQWKKHKETNLHGKLKGEKS